MTYDQDKVKDEDALPYSTVQMLVQISIFPKCHTRLLHATEQHAGELA